MTIPILVAEGTAEEAILDLLLDNKYLIFSRDEILFQEVFASLNSKDLAEKLEVYDFEDPNTNDLQKFEIYVVLDSKNFKFELSKKFTKNFGGSFDTTVYFVTREEIEAVQLQYSNEYLKKYQKYKAKNVGKKKKPSAFFKCSKQQGGLGIRNIKDYNYVKSMWEDDVPSLVEAIRKVKRDMGKRGALGNCKRGYLADLLK